MLRFIFSCLLILTLIAGFAIAKEAPREITERDISALAWRAIGPVFVDPGTYTVTISVDGESSTQTVEVAAYPGYVAPEEKSELPPARP